MSATGPDVRPPPLDPASVRRVLRESGLRARHSLSQNFLVDVEVLEAILAEAAPAPGRRVFEIGPGLGILTGALLAAGASVTAIELDRGLVTRLRGELAAAIELGRRDPSAPGALTLVEGDVLDVDRATLLAPPFDVVANLPYHITSPVLHRLLGEPPRPDRLVLMVQREVAERIAAEPGAMSYLSVFVRYHASARIAFLVPRAAFEPEPSVGSAVVVLDATDGIGGLDPEDEDELWRVVQAAFRERRKMIHNVLARQLPADAPRIDAALRAAGIAPDRRPQTLAVEEWLRLRAALTPIGPDTRGRPRPPERP